MTHVLTPCNTISGDYRVFSILLASFAVLITWSRPLLVSNFQKICALDLADDVSAAILSPHLCKVQMLFIPFTCIYECNNIHMSALFCAIYINDNRHKQPSMFSTTL